MSNSVNADSLARVHTAEAVGVVVDIMRNASKPEHRLKAAETILDRGHGRAVQAVISVPARQATAIRLAGMSDAELLQIAKGGGGSIPRKGSPQAGALGGGTILGPTGQFLPAIEGEFTEIDDDPCG